MLLDPINYCVKGILLIIKREARLLWFYNKLCGKFKFHTAFFVIQSTKKAIPVKLISEQKNIRIGIALYGL